MKIVPEFQQAFKLSLPTLFTYLPFGVIFAILWVKAGFPGYLAIFMSAFAYAGVAQMIALSMMQEHASIIAISVAVTFIALRNVFYGLNFIDRFAGMSKLLRAFLIFGLVDATYGILVTNQPKPSIDDGKFCFYVTFLPYIYWVIGTALGVCFFSNLPTLPELEFVLVSFFMILVIDYYQVHRDKLCIFMPILIAIIAYCIYPQQFLLLSIIFSTIFIYVFDNHKLAKQRDKI